MMDEREVDWQQLLDDLQSGDAAIAEDARWSLIEASPLPAEAAPRLSALISHPDAAVCASAAHALGELDDPPAEAVPLLLDLLHSGDGNVREGARHALSTIKPRDPETIRRLIAALDDPLAAGHSMGVLLQLGRDAHAAMGALIAALPTSEHAEDILTFLADNPADAEACLPALIECLQRPEEGVRQQAAETLYALGEAAEPAMPALLAALNDEEFFTRIAAEGEELWMGAPRQLMDVVRKATERRPTEVRLAIAEALWHTCGHRAGLKAMIDALQDPAPCDRRVALDCVLHAATPAKFAVPLLSYTWRHAPTNVRLELLTALGRLGKRAIPLVPLAAAALDEDDAEIRFAAARCLANLGKHASQGKLALRRRLQRESLGSVRAGIALALWRIAPHKRWIRALVDLLGDRSPFVRREAALCLGRIGPPALAARSPLADLIEDPDLDVRKAAAEAIGEIEGKRDDDG